MAATHYISKGQFTKVETHRCDEIGQVIASFNGMVDTLEYNENAVQSYMKKLEASENNLKKSLREKEVLLKEIHHRVKNNLNIVTSLLNLQLETISSTEEAKKSLKISQDRVYSMALVHEKLYESDTLAEIDMNSYIRSLVSELYELYGLGRDIDIKTDVEDIYLSIDYAVPCGLLLNELITNAMVHAFPKWWYEQGRKPHISITMQKTTDHHVLLLVEDNGIGSDRATATGSSEDASFSRESLGLQLVHILSDQIGGSLHISNNRGMCFRITFPLR